MQARRREALLRLRIAGTLLGVLALVAGCILFREAGVIVAFAVLVVAALVWMLQRGNPWRGWQPPAGVTVEEKPTEIPALSDHPDVVGRTATHLIQGDGWSAFDVLGREHAWVVAIPLRRDAAPWHAEPLSLVVQRAGRAPLEERYLAVGVPEPVKAILAAHDLEPDLRCLGDVLIARYPGMGPRNFGRWYAEELPVLLAIRDAVTPAEPVELPAIESTTALNAAGRNVWTPLADAETRAPEKFPVLQPSPEVAGVVGREDR